MDETSTLLEDLTVPQQCLRTSYCKLYLEILLVDQVVNPSPSLVDPTLSLKSEVEVIDPSPSLVDPTLPLESEVKVVESMSSPPNPTLLSESVEIELVPSTESSSSSYLPLESENHLTEVFVVSFDCSMQEEVLYISIEPYPSSEVISFDWSNLIEYHLHSSVTFQIFV